MIGDTQWFVDTEQKYGGLVTGVPRKVWSPKEKRPEVPSLMMGGDRMSQEQHGYAKSYARHLSFLIQHRTEPLVVVEIGVLCGTGLAIWSDLFPNATIIGLDIDLSNFHSNANNLRNLGAFPEREPELYHFDQLLDGQAEIVTAILAKRKVDLVVDDGCHKDDAIIASFSALLPHFREHSVYFAEDNWTVAGHLSSLVPSNKDTMAEGTLTIVRKRCACW